MIRYSEERERSLPHVVNVSGGKSSAMMLLRCIEDGDLDAGRGDVALFNNTTAEHPETYAFLRRLTKRCESFGIPFYWTEYCTVETLSKTTGEYIRKPTYRMTLPTEHDEISCPDGYRTKGEAFEELCAYAGFLPNRWQRTCTASLKVGIKVEFLADWFDSKQAIESAGHSFNASQITDEDWIRRHRRHRGKLDDSTLLRFKSFLSTRPTSRPAQRFDRFSAVGKTHRHFEPDEYFGIVGIRADEPKRIERMTALGGGELINLPLADNDVTKDDVDTFWRELEKEEPGFGLQIDSSRSNCVYCFMKGPRALAALAASDAGDSESPASLRWWQRLERKYRREHKKETFGQVDLCASGFFGEYMIDDPKRADYSNIEAAPDPGLPCDCTD